ncbi:YkvA family protein [Kribbella sp. NPDC005582]|uniref:YkvA family protein n=1 Tax=Kribbella sp. NPDC005582 TaxID=3156893 RepID=UPI0033BADC2D
MWKDLLVGLGAAIVVAWLALVIALLLVRPKGNVLREALRILPDLIRLLKDLATDSSQPRGVRIRLVLLMAYLAIPIDLIPDFIPVLGYADDAIIVVAVLRSIVRRVGLEPPEVTLARYRGRLQRSLQGSRTVRSGLGCGRGWRTAGRLRAGERR